MKNTAKKKAHISIAEYLKKLGIRPEGYDKESSWVKGQLTTYFLTRKQDKDIHHYLDRVHGDKLRTNKDGAIQFDTGSRVFEGGHNNTTFATVLYMDMDRRRVFLSHHIKQAEIDAIKKDSKVAA